MAKNQDAAKAATISPEEQAAMDAAAQSSLSDADLMAQRVAELEAENAALRASKAEAPLAPLPSKGKRIQLESHDAIREDH